MENSELTKHETLNAILTVDIAQNLEISNYQMCQNCKACNCRGRIDSSYETKPITTEEKERMFEQLYI
jgi:hypothetical protein